MQTSYIPERKQYMEYFPDLMGERAFQQQQKNSEDVV